MSDDSNKLLEVRDLRTHFYTDAGVARAVEDDKFRTLGWCRTELPEHRRDLSPVVRAVVHDVLKHLPDGHPVSNGEATIPC